MSREQVRVLLIALFAAAAILSAVGNASGRPFLTALGFGCFSIGAIVVVEWRRRLRGRVLNRGEKTSRDE